jgi:RNA polymerase sigma-70 factor (ECF subfamily)
MIENGHPEVDQLMARLADGDRAVFTDLFHLLWPPIERFCRGFLKNDADAADAAQEALQKVFERAAAYDKSRSAMPWALAIAGWECRTLARRRTRRRELSDENQPEPGTSDDEERLVQRELVDAAMGALGHLSDADREALIATYWDTAAPVTGATFRKRRERALDRLRSSFRRIYGID